MNILSTSLILPQGVGGVRDESLRDRCGITLDQEAYNDGLEKKGRKRQTWSCEEAA